MSNHFFPLLNMCWARLSRSVMSESLRPHGLHPARLLCPWDFPGKNTGVGCHSLPHGVFPTQGSNPGLPHCRQVLHQLSHEGSPLLNISCWKEFYATIAVLYSLLHFLGPVNWLAQESTPALVLKNGRCFLTGGSFEAVRLHMN